MKYIRLYESFSQSTILYLHGLNSFPWADRIEIMKSSGANVIASELDYEKEDASKIALDIMKNNKITHLVGHSMGGLLAFHLSNIYDLPVLMFNPAFGSKNAKLVTIDSTTSSLSKNKYAVVGMSDDVIDPNVQIENLSKANAKIWKIQMLGHRISPTIFQTYFQKFAEATNI